MELVLLRPRPARSLIGLPLKSIGALLSVKEGNWFSVETGGGQNGGELQWRCVHRQTGGWIRL